MKVLGLDMLPAGLIPGYGPDASGFGSARALAAAVEASHMAQNSSSANLSFSPNVTYTLAPGMAPMAGKKVHVYYLILSASFFGKLKMFITIFF